MQLLDVVRISFTEFKPFATRSLSADGSEVLVRDRGQFRELLKARGMIEKGDSNNYFGSNPKSVPTFEEIAKFGKGGISDKTKKLIKAGMIGALDAKEWEGIRKQDKQTKSGRAAKIPMTERERKTIYQLKNQGGVALAGR